MSHLTMRLMVTAVTIFSFVLLLIRAQPYDDHELRQLLLPENCPAPCFIGIRPGVTTTEEAVTILETSEWIAKLDKRVLENRYGLITVSWSDKKPVWIKKNQEGEIFVKNKRVKMITIYTNISIGEIRLSLGQPDMEVVDARQDQTKQFAYYYAFYPQRGLSMQNLLRCGITEPLHNAVNIMMTEPRDTVPTQATSLNTLLRVC